jgi:uncharacterized membrane protein SirB2
MLVLGIVAILAGCYLLYLSYRDQEKTMRIIYYIGAFVCFLFSIVVAVGQITLSELI